MNKPKLTIGFSTYSDYDGVYFTIQALRLNNDLRECEIVIVDNNKESGASKLILELVADAHLRGNMGVRYFTCDINGTTQGRNMVFEVADGEWVLVIDSHVLLQPYAIARLLKYIEAHPDSNNLYSGPLMRDSMNEISTHFIDKWNDSMWGIWGNAWVAPNGQRFSVIMNEKTQKADFITLEMNHVVLTELNGKPVPDIDFYGYFQQLTQMGYKPLGFADDEEFNIPGMGLGLFCCRKAAWPGFNKHFRGFGGEEMYIHNKVRKAGGQCVCLTFLKWLHRFGRVNNVTGYKVTFYDRLRNYILGAVELNEPLGPIHAHFVLSGKVTQAEYDYILKDPINNITFDISKALSTVDDMYVHLKKIPRDLDQHFDWMRELASKCQVVTEFSKRRESFVAFAAGKPEKLISYNQESGDPFVRHTLSINPGYFCMDGTSGRVITILDTDMLFIDSQHNEQTLNEELRKFANNVRRFILLRGTHANAIHGEQGGRGLHYALIAFLKNNPQWFVIEHRKNQYGMTLLGRLPEDKPAEVVDMFHFPTGPGTELHQMLASIGVVARGACDCRTRMGQMDAWGVEGCKQNRAEIIGWMNEGHGRWGWGEKMKIAGRAWASGFAAEVRKHPSFSYSDPFPAIIDIAIERAEEKNKRAQE